MDRASQAAAEPERRAQALEHAIEIYRDARSRSSSIRAAALTALGLLSLLIGVATPSGLTGLGWWAILPLAVLGAGFICSLAVLLTAPVSLPFDSTPLRTDAFVLADLDGVLRAMLEAVAKAEENTKCYNNRAAGLANVSMSAFVFSVIVIGFQIGIGAARGLLAGSIVAALGVGVAFLLRWKLLVPRKEAGKR